MSEVKKVKGLVIPEKGVRVQECSVNSGTLADGRPWKNCKVKFGDLDAFLPSFTLKYSESSDAFAFNMLSQLEKGKKYLLGFEPSVVQPKEGDPYITLHLVDFACLD